MRKRAADSAQAFPDRLHLLRLDHSGAHTAQQLTVPDNVGLVFWPPYGPERSPIAHVWRDLKDALAGLQFPNLDGQHDDGAMLLRGYEAITRQALTGCSSLVEAIHALRL
jgi:putative transposase